MKTSMFAARLAVFFLMGSATWFGIAYLAMSGFSGMVVD